MTSGVDDGRGDKQPYMPWYGRDYLGDVALQSCSLAARGVAANFFAYVGCESPIRGMFVMANGLKPNWSQAGVVLRCTADEAESALNELLTANAIRVTPDGILYSARIVRSAKKSEACAESARKRWENSAQVKTEKQTDSSIRNANRNAKADAKLMRISGYGSGYGSNSSSLNEEVQEEGATPTIVPATSPVDIVIAHYRTYHPKARPGKKERDLISARLREGYSQDDLCRAIDGNHVSPHHNGRNDNGAKYNSLELIFRSSSKVSGFMDAHEAHLRGDFDQVRHGPLTAAEANIERILAVVAPQAKLFADEDAELVDGVVQLESRFEP